MLNDKGEEVGIIYGWYNIKCGKWYVGQTVNPEGRFNCHIDRAINKKDKTYFYNSIRKYGLENFVYCVLEENVLRENLNMREMDWIEEFDSFYSGYNLTLGGDGSKGFIMPDETKKKLSNFHKGKHLSDETKKKLSNILKGKPLSEEHKKKISEANKGKTFSIETKKKLSESHKGKISPNRKKVSQYDLNGNYIQTYNSVTDAIKENPKCSNISRVCIGERKQAGGFIWKYAS